MRAFASLAAAGLVTVGLSAPVSADPAVVPAADKSVAAAGVYHRWPGRIITVRNTIPGEAGRIAARAVADWNNAGLRTKFKLVKFSRADVVMKLVRRTPCGSAGCADLGYLPGRQSTVWLLGNPSAPQKITDPTWYMTLISHELGHILGLNHTSGSHDLMHPAPRSAVVTTSGKCRQYTRTELKPLRRAYGARMSMKRALRPKTTCRLRPLPGPVPDLRVSGPHDGSVEISWGDARGAASYLVLRGKDGAPCPTAPDSNDAEALPTRGRTAVDWGAQEGATYCYRVFPFSAEGFTKSASAASQTLKATTPRPAPPTVSVQLIPGDTLPYEISVTGWDGDVTYSVGEQGQYSDEVYGGLWPGSPITLYDRPADGKVYLRFWQEVRGYGFGDPIRSAPTDVTVDLPVRDYSG